MRNLHSPRSLYVTDLDGTLLGRDGLLSERAAELLTRLIRDRGALITYATSRSPEKARSLLRGAPFELPAIVLNGAMLVDPKTGEALEVAPLGEATAESILAICARLRARPFVLGRHADRDVLHFGEPANEAQRQFIDRRRAEPRMRFTEPLCPAPTTLAVMLIDREPVLEGLCAAIDAELPGVCELKRSEEICARGWHLLEIVAARVDKARMLERLCAPLGVELIDVTVFGDQPTDGGMMAIAGTAVAVSNAHPSILARADVILGSNDVDAVPRYIWNDHRREDA